MQVANVVSRFTVILISVGCLVCQQTQPPLRTPSVIRISDTFHPANGLAASPVESVTLSLYREQHGGVPLWTETQNVDVDAEGRFSALMGSTSPDGIPQELFAASESRWLGIRFNRSREFERPRTLVVSVPYAMQAADAEMLGGLPASAYALAQPELSSKTGADKPIAPRPREKVGNLEPRAAIGLPNCIGLFTTAFDLGCSSLWQSGDGSIGVGTTNPGILLDGSGSTLSTALLVDNSPSGKVGGFVVGGARILDTTPAQRQGYFLRRLDRWNAYNNGLWAGARSSGAEYWENVVLGAQGGGANLVFMTGSPQSERMRVDTSGNIGVGTAAPGRMLDGAGGFIPSPLLVDVNPSNKVGGFITGGPRSLDATPAQRQGYFLRRLDQWNAYNTGLWTGARSSGSEYWENLILGAQGGGANLIFMTGGVQAERMRISASGSVGIGTVSPAVKLDVAGQIRSSSGGFVFPDGTVQTSAATSGGGGTSQWAAAAGGAISYSAGNVGIGISSPGAKLDVTGDINLSGALKIGTIPVLTSNAASGNLSSGSQALEKNTTGTNNTAQGANTLTFNTTGNQNTAQGNYALYANTTGSYNTAQGYGALRGATVGVYNTATGVDALAVTTGAGYNTAHGALALSSTTIGQNNTGTGYNALRRNTTGSQNTAAGYGALFSNTGGNNNTAAGFNALYGTTGSNNIGVGYHAGYFATAGNDNIHIGSQGISGDTARIRIGTPGTQTSFFVAGIRGVTTGSSNAVPVVIDSNGQLGTVSSSRRFKEDIRDMDDASRAILRLRPVTFRYKRPFGDAAKPLQYGLIAEEVAEVFPDLVARSADGQVETVKYQLLDALLLNEVQRQQSELDAQAGRIKVLEQKVADQQRQNHELQDRLEKLEAALARISR